MGSWNQPAVSGSEKAFCLYLKDSCPVALSQYSEQVKEKSGLCGHFYHLFLESNFPSEFHVF